MDPARRQSIGNLGLSVTQMGLGGTGFGNIYAPVSDQEAAALAKVAYDAGIRYFDTAPLYGVGLSETRLGAGLAQYDRSELVISTKVGYTLVPASEAAGGNSVFVETPPLSTVFDFSRDAVLRSLESSLTRLGTDHVDILLIHDPDESIRLKPGMDPYQRSHFQEVMDGAYPALAELRSQQVVRAIGLGMNQWQMLADFARAGDFDCFLLAGRYTLLEQESLRELLPLCDQKGIRIILGGPYNSGILATGAIEGAYFDYGPAPPEILERVRRIEAVCREHGVSLQAAALQFPMAHPAVASIIPGARSTAELTANLDFFREPIPTAFWQQLQSEQLLEPAAPIPSGDGES